MKTITEMQTQIKEMSSKLNDVARELSDYNKSENQGVDIDFKQIKAIGIRNPIIGHILEKTDVSVKKKYITMLIAIAYMAKEKQENAWLLIQRIATGANFTEELIDLSVDAVNITEAQIDEFTLNIANAKLTNSFVLDAMLIYLSYENGNEKMLGFLAMLFELVKCGKKEVQELSELARIIAEQNSNKYLEFCFKELEIDITESFGYIKTFHDGILACNSKFFILEFHSKKNISKETVVKLPKVITSSKVSVKNIIFEEFTKDDKWVEFEKCGDISITYCNFTTLEKCINVKESGNIMISDSIFKTMSNRALNINDSESLTIRKCKFDNCSYRTDDKWSSYGHQKEAYGGAMYLSFVKNVQVTDCEFEYCSSKQGKSGIADGAVAYLFNVELSNWNNNIFKSCKSSIWSNSWLDRGDIFYIKECLSISAKNCTYSDSSIPYQVSRGFKKMN